tara:strand:+ start:1018 stop:1410 length:393 start_codon:yes stop_codon:yes gene_type:complete
MPSKLSDFIKSINSTKKKMEELDEDFETTEKEYYPFVVNRCLSYFPDTIMQVNAMNTNGHLSKKMQYDFLVGSIRKRSRFHKWAKKDKDKRLSAICEYYQISSRKASEVINILTTDQILTIQNACEKGGN